MFAMDGVYVYLFFAVAPPPPCFLRGINGVYFYGPLAVYACFCFAFFFDFFFARYCQVRYQRRLFLRAVGDGELRPVEFEVE
jgi:hypothetical protein